MNIYKVTVEYSKQSGRDIVLAKSVYENVRMCLVAENYIRILEKGKLEIKKISYERIWSVKIEREIG